MAMKRVAAAVTTPTPTERRWKGLLHDLRRISESFEARRARRALSAGWMTYVQGLHSELSEGRTWPSGHLPELQDPALTDALKFEHPSPWLVETAASLNTLNREQGVALIDATYRRYPNGRGTNTVLVWILETVLDRDVDLTLQLIGEVSELSSTDADTLEIEIFGSRDPTSAHAGHLVTRRLNAITETILATTVAAGGRQG